MTLRLWLLVLDAVAWLGLFGSPVYLWVVRRASGAEWRDG